MLESWASLLAASTTSARVATLGSRGVRAGEIVRSHATGSVLAVSRYAVVRLWLMDRPGSLGRIATRIGELGGDLVGIDILERDGARVVDELTVELPAGYAPDDLVVALSELPGVEVEDLRHLVSRVPYGGRDPLEAAVLLARARSTNELAAMLAQGVCTAFACEWCTLLDTGGDKVTSLAVVGSPPSATWLNSFVTGAQGGLSLFTPDSGPVGPRDVAWAVLGSSPLVLVTGRDGPPFRSRERDQLQQLCRVAEARWNDLLPTAVNDSAPSSPGHSP